MCWWWFDDGDADDDDDNVYDGDDLDVDSADDNVPDVYSAKRSLIADSDRTHGAKSSAVNGLPLSWSRSSKDAARFIFTGYHFL